MKKTSHPQRTQSGREDCRLYTMADLATLMGVTQRYVQALRKQGAPFAMGRSRPDWLVEWIKNCRIQEVTSERTAGETHPVTGEARARRGGGAKALRLVRFETCQFFPQLKSATICKEKHPHSDPQLNFWALEAGFKNLPL